ncbi:MAG: hypothetical protein ACLFVJ_18875, partial [Persicimonas sp.]
MSKKIEMSEWKKVGLALKVMRQILFKSVVPRISGKLPSSLQKKSINKLERWLDKTRSRMEDRMFEEHPSEATVGEFYPDNSNDAEEIGRLVEEEICEAIEQPISHADRALL